MYNSYQRLCTLYYDLGKPTAPENELTFYLNYARNSRGPLLEPMCGTGRFFIPMLEHGFDIEGFDASEHMLEVLQQKCIQKNLPSPIWQQWLHMFNSKRSYGFIFIPSGSFGLIVDQEQAHYCLQILYDHLLPGGKLVFEVETPAAFTLQPNVWQSSTLKRDNSSLIILKRLPQYTQQTHILTVFCHYQLIQNDIIIEEEVENFTIKLYQANELDSYLNHLGFALIKYKACTQKLFNHNDPIITYECTKS